MGERRGVDYYLAKHRRAVLAVLMLPVAASLIALLLTALLRGMRPLILYVAVGLVLTQYLFLVRYILKRLEG
jgi:hypothetical protein